MEDLLEDLNEAQREAVTATEGCVRVIAGAGSGKTRALSHRFAYLVNELGILPGHILCVTFTSKSANEMRQRIHRLTGDNDTGYINTFHGFCNSILQEDSHAVQYPKNFLVLDNSDIDDMLKIIYEERGLSLRDMTFARARDMFEIRKTIEEQDYLKDMIAMPLTALKDKYDRAVKTEDILFYGYLYQEKKCFGLDYNDLIMFALHIFSEHPDIREKWQKRLEYIMIDEFQDIDGLQHKLMEILAGYHHNLFIVGDPDQTIYTWRGADVKFLLEFDKNFPHTRTIMLNENYRSTPQVLHAANALIGVNKSRIKKDLIPVRGDGESVRCHFAGDAAAEADWITGEMLVLKGKGVPWRDMAVLYRAHYVSRTIEEAMIREDIPYTITSGVPFFARAEIKDALCYLRMVVFRDDLSFRRIVNVPKRNMGNRRMRFLEEAAAANGGTLYESLVRSLEDPLFKGTKAQAFVDLIERFAAALSAQTPASEMLAKLLDESGYEEALRTEGAQDRLDNLAELKQSVHEYETSCGEETAVEDYLRHIALFTNADAVSDRVDKVRLMTVHAAKGLEFPYVFLPGLNEGIFPSRKVHTLPGMEEERRLAFVAMTRTKDRLYLSEAGGTGFEGIPRYPSRFLLEIDPALLEYTAQPDEQLLRAAKDYIERDRRTFLPAAEALFSEGDRVRHAAFGTGIILAVDREDAAYTVQFDRLETPRRLTFRVKMKPENGGEAAKSGEADDA
ncbi:MAG: UvrD-helicase domain-containing protein [Lachnospiraceae bacterium]|nr:UvrD-helicase domain-containing protein [Lachnospiraceae bacterium]